MPGVVDSFGDLKAISAPDVWAGSILVRVPKVLFGSVANLDHISKPLGSHHCCPRKASRKKCVGGDRGAVRKQFYVNWFYSTGAQTFEHCQFGLARRGGHLLNMASSSAL